MHQNLIHKFQYHIVGQHRKVRISPCKRKEFLAAICVRFHGIQDCLIGCDRHFQLRLLGFILLYELFIARKRNVIQSIFLE